MAEKELNIHKANNISLSRQNKKRQLAAVEKLLKVVIDRKGEFLSPEYLTSQIKYRFKCLMEHTFEMTSNKVLMGSWCSECSTGLYERLCREHFEQMFKLKFPKKRPNWLNGLELDGYCEELKLAFEYNGGQHYRYTPYYQRSEEEFNKLKIRDQIKRELCKQNNVRLVIIPEIKRVSQFNNGLVGIIKDECIKISSEILKDIYTEMIDVARAYLPPELKIIQEVKEIAESKDGELRSNIYLGYDFKMIFYCKKHQYEWGSAPYLIKKGHWCPMCSGTLLKTLEDCQKLAFSKQGKCLAEEYKNARTRMPWKCKIEEHPVFSTTFDSINRGSWCKECAKIQAKKDNDTKRDERSDEIVKLCSDYAEKKGGKCFMKREEYINCNTKVLWKCEKDEHKVWESTIASVTKQNTWCPECMYEKTKFNLPQYKGIKFTDKESEIIDTSLQISEPKVSVQQEKLF